MSRRWIVIPLVFSVVVAVAAPSARSAAPIPADAYAVNLVGGNLHVGAAAMPMDYPFAVATLGTIDLNGTDPASFRLPVAGRSLQPVSAQTAFGDVTVTETFTQDVTGTVTRSTGEMTARVRVTASVTVGGPTGFTCALGTAAAPIGFEPTTQPPGSRFDTALTATVADDRFVIPALSDCSGGVDASSVNALVGLPAAAGASFARVKLALVSTATTTPSDTTQPPAGTPLPPPVTGVTPRLTVAGATATVRNGRATVRLTCTRAATQCKGQLEILPTAPGRALGKAPFAIPVGRTIGVRVSLNRAARSTMRRRGSLQARARATVKGATATVTRRVVLRSA